jgi:hypothetical protein
MDHAPRPDQSVPRVAAGPTRLQSRKRIELSDAIDRYDIQWHDGHLQRADRYTIDHRVDM